MKVIYFLTLFALANSHQNVDLDEEGVLHVNEAYGIRPGGSWYEVKSYKYPEQSPPKLLQTWRFQTFPDARIRVVCSEVRTPSREQGKCDPEYVLILEDGSERSEFCGGRYDFTFLSKSNEILFTLKTGPSTGAYVNCSVQGREMGPYGEVTEAPTTPGPPTTLVPPFRLIETEEIDSSEHGVSRGKKGTNCDCGRANKKNSRIVGGKETEVSEYPHMVALVFQQATYAQFCGGSIITPYHVITAAHCTYKYKEIPLAVRIGDHNIEKEPEFQWTKIVNVVETVEHEKFNKQVPLVYDIALMVLEEEVKFNKFVGPLCLPRGRLNLDNENVKITGWGLVSNVGPGSPVLKVVNVRVVPEEECFGEITPDGTRLCTYARNRSSCRGDSGGPVTWLDPETNRYTLVGLVSYGSTCGGRYPMVNADVTRLLDWVYDKVRDTKPNAQVCTKV